MTDMTSDEVKRGAMKLGRALPGTMGAFNRLHAAALADGELTASTKELIAMAISVATGCGGCIAYHGERALEAGATKEQYLEAVGVAVLMGGGPASVYGARAAELLETAVGESEGIA
jgi:AhpD family alkylhydroperoxidase